MTESQKSNNVSQESSGTSESMPIAGFLVGLLGVLILAMTALGVDPVVMYKAAQGTVIVVETATPVVDGSIPTWDVTFVPSLTPTVTLSPVPVTVIVPSATPTEFLDQFPTPEIVVTPYLTYTPVSIECQVYVTESDYTNIRSGPGLSYGVIGRMLNCDEGSFYRCATTVVPDDDGWLMTNWPIVSDYVNVYDEDYHVGYIAGWVDSLVYSAACSTTEFPYAE